MVCGPRPGAEDEHFLTDLTAALRIGAARVDAERTSALLSPDVLCVLKGGKRARDAAAATQMDAMCEDSDGTEDDGRPPLGPAPAAKRARVTTDDTTNGGRASQFSTVSENEMALFSYRVSDLRTDIEHCRKALPTATTDEERQHLQIAKQKLEEQLNDVILRIESNTAFGRSQVAEEE